MNIKRSIVRTVLLLLVGVGVLCALLYFLIFKAFAEMRPAELFPLNDPKGEYTIFRTRVRINGNQTWQYWLSYKGKLVYGKEGLPNQATLPVGQSAVDLQQLMGSYQSQQIRLKGNIGTSTRQCIVNACIPLSTFTETQVANISEVIE